MIKILHITTSLNSTPVKNIRKDLKYYQYIQDYFCDNIHSLYNKDLEEKIFLLNVSLNNIKFDFFIYDNNDLLNLKYKFNLTLEIEGTYQVLKALKYYADKYKYRNNEITLMDFGANLGWYTIFFGILNYSIISFEPLYENNYILKKNFCRNNKNFFGIPPSITIINETLYPTETFCNYFQDSKNKKKYLIFCDETKEKNLEKDYIKIGKLKTIESKIFIPFIKDKLIALLILDLEYEGEIILQNIKEFIIKYHITYILIKFYKTIFKIHESKPEDFLGFFIKHGYKISLNGFITKQFISINDISLKLYLNIKNQFN